MELYRDQHGQSYVLDVVKKVEQEIANEQHQNKDYLRISGLQSFVTGALKMLFGANCNDIQTGLIQGVQSISGTGAYRLACELSAPSLSAVVLQGAGHNPTGVDFTEDQWKVIADIMIVE
ncbi:hypothetical protein MXB_1940 [Myxobolus squamalis]|nr:hypothetical protein MXB_1940 [Myxobolus squamalis]